MTDRQRPQDLALTILGSHLRAPGAMVRSAGMVELLGAFGFTSGAARAALARLAARNLLARVKSGRHVSYVLTSRAERLLADGDRRIFAFGREDCEGPWTFVWHAIPEDRRVERARLAAGLRFLGFGSAQDATWVAAHDRRDEVYALLESIAAERQAFVFVGEPSPGTDLRALVAQAWDLPALEKAYRAFLEEFEPPLDPPDDEAAFVARTRLLHRFRGFPSLDPELAAPSLRGRAVATFHRVYAALREPAERHFEKARG